MIAEKSVSPTDFARENKLQPRLILKLLSQVGNANVGWKRVDRVLKIAGIDDNSPGKLWVHALWETRGNINRSLLLMRDQFSDFVKEFTEGTFPGMRRSELDFLRSTAACVKRHREPTALSSPIDILRKVLDLSRAEPSMLFKLAEELEKLPINHIRRRAYLGDSLGMSGTSGRVDVMAYRISEGIFKSAAYHPLDRTSFSNDAS